MKKTIVAGFVGLGFAVAAHAAIVYEDHFDNDSLATNTNAGGGLSVTAAANAATWGDSGALDFSPDNGDANERATVSSINPFYLSGGFELTVMYSVSDITTDTAGNRFSFGLVSHAPDFNVDPFALASGTRPSGFTSFGLNVTAEDLLQGLAINTTGTVALVAGQSGFTSSTTEVNTLTLSVDDIGDYDLMLNDSSVGSGASGLNLSNAFYFTAFSQDNLANPSISSVSLSRLADGNIPPFANDQDVTTFPGTPVEITLTGIDYDGSNLTYSVDDSMLAGSLAGATNVWTYTPTNGSFQGVDRFTFTVNDGETNSAPATVAITVTNQVPIANAQSAVVFANTNVNIMLTGSDPDNGPSNLTYSVASQPTNGLLSGTAPDLTYTPTSGYQGADSFTFTVNDGLGDSDPATVSITVEEPATIIASYEFYIESTVKADNTTEANDPTPFQATTTNANVTVTTFGGGSGTLNPQVWAVTDAISTTETAGLEDGTGDNMAGAIAAGQYFTFTVTANTGYTLDLKNLTFDILRAARGAKDYAVQYSLDGFATTGTDIVNYANDVISEVSAPGVTQDIDLSADVFNSLTKIEFRIYLDDRANNNLASSSVSIDNVMLRGTVDSGGVPEPENFGLEMASGDVVLSWEGGGSYTVLTNENLVDPDWGILKSGTSPITNAIGSEPQLFYKLESSE